MNRSVRQLAALTAILLLQVYAPGCEPEDWIITPDCNECFGFRPDSAQIIVYVTIDAENDSVPITLFKGDVNGPIDWQDTAVESPYYLSSEIGVSYTVRAEYTRDGTSVVALDSDEMTLSDYGEDCGDPCYIVKGGIFDVELAR